MQAGHWPKQNRTMSLDTRMALPDLGLSKFCIFGDADRQSKRKHTIINQQHNVMIGLGYINDIESN